MLHCMCCLQPYLDQSNRRTSRMGPDVALCSWQNAHVARVHGVSSFRKTLQQHVEFIMHFAGKQA